MTAAPIEVRDLSKRFGSVVAVDNLSFEVALGRITGLLGPNGSGKTTTLRMMVGLVTPTHGSASINGGPYSALANPLAAVGALAFTLLNVVANVFAAGQEGGSPPLETAQGLRNVFGSASGATVFVLMLGVLSVSGEFRHGTITTSLLAVPSGREWLAPNSPLFRCSGPPSGWRQLWSQSWWASRCWSSRMST